MDVALDLAEPVTLLNYGEVITHGTRDEVVADQRTQEVYLGTDALSLTNVHTFMATPYPARR